MAGRAKGKKRTKEELLAIEVCGKTLAEWDKEWQNIPGGFSVIQPQLRNYVGLYRALEKNLVTAIGTGVEHSNGGLRKRLRDFNRESSSARNHWIGIYIHEMQNQLVCQVLITGSDVQAAVIAKNLKPLMEEFHEPKENVPAEIVIAQIAAKDRKKK